MPRSAQVLIMLVCSSEVGKLLPVNHWSNTAGNRESSSALLTFRIPFWGNKRGASPGWLGLLVLCGRPLSTHNPSKSTRLFARCHSLMSVSPQRGGGAGQMARGARATQLWHLLWCTLSPPPGLEWWSEKKKKGKRALLGQAVVKCKWRRSMSRALWLFRKIGWDVLWTTHRGPRNLPN